LPLIRTHVALFAALSINLAACSMTRDVPSAPDPQLTALVVVPESADVDAGAQLQFAVFGRGANGDSVGSAVVTWRATGGTITANGLFTADTVEGDFSVRASSPDGRLAASSRVKVRGRKRTLAQVVIAPASTSLTPGGTQQFLAYGRLGNGDSVGVAVSYAATGGSITSAGLYTAGPTTGSYRVMATEAGGLADTAAVTITSTPPPVASVSVTPESASLTAGQTVQLTATPRDASGNPLSGRVVTWSTSSAAVATVSASGLVSAVAPGAATITATSEGQGGEAAITVIAAPAAAECAAPRAGWIWCDDFEQDRLASYFEYDNAGGSFTRAAGVGRSASAGMRVRFGSGQVNAGALHLAFGRTPQSYFRPVDAGTANYREIYWRMYVRHQAGWVGGGGDKLSRAMIFASSSSWAQAMFAHVWSGTGTTQNYLFIDPASGTDEAGNLRTTQYNDFANMRWLGSARSVTPLFDAAHVGQWYCVEARARLNDAGQSNGVFQLWIDGRLDAERTGLNWVGSFNAYGINAVFFENYWNAGSPQAQERYFDNLVVSTQPIGC
jgi:hypothetical protein